MILIENLSKKFGKILVLDNISLDCSQGKCIALIGHNACGKTTLIKSILGMVVPTQGNIFFENKNIKNEYLYRRNIGYMPQIGRYPENMSIGKIVEMVKELRGDCKKYDEDLFQAFEIKKIYDKKIHTLSGGTRQKVSAVLAFLFQPKVLILDEPTAGLDPIASEILKEKIVVEKQKGKLILITSHQLSELDELVDEVILMREGKVQFHESLDFLQEKTQEYKISKAIAKLLNEQNPKKVFSEFVKE